MATKYFFIINVILLFKTFDYSFDFIFDDFFSRFLFVLMYEFLLNIWFQKKNIMINNGSNVVII